MRRIKDDKKEWRPCSNDRVCSEHFVDGLPTCENPNPTLKLGYKLKQTIPRRKLFREPLIKKPRNQPASTSTNPFADIKVATPCNTGAAAAALLSPPPSPPSLSYLDLSSSSLHSEHSYCTFTRNSIKCYSCDYKDALINSYKKKLEALTKQNRLLKRGKLLNESKHTPFSWKFIKTDKKMNFYTGLSTIKLFEAVYNLLSPYFPRLCYWRGTKRVISSKVKKEHFVQSNQKNLTPKNEFLLTLMRLRLTVLNEDLADRFGISVTTCSNIFKTWTRFLAQTLGKLVAWLPKENILDNMPKAFRKAGHSNLRVIIDCSEVFIERSKALDVQAATWSDYKSHNTIKFLIGISPAGFVTFLSDCYSGRSSDKFITADCGFYECLEPYDEVMADRGFQLKKNLC